MKNRKLCDATKIRWPVGLEHGIFYKGFGPFMPHHFANRCALTHSIVTILGYTNFNKHEKLIMISVIGKMLSDNSLLDTWMTYENIANISGISKPTVIKIVTSLRERGYLLVKTFDNSGDDDDPVFFYQIGKKLFFNQNFIDSDKCKRSAKLK